MLATRCAAADEAKTEGDGEHKSKHEGHDKTGGVRVGIMAARLTTAGDADPGKIEHARDGFRFADADRHPGDREALEEGFGDSLSQGLDEFVLTAPATSATTS